MKTYKQFNKLNELVGGIGDEDIEYDDDFDPESHEEELLKDFEKDDERTARRAKRIDTNAHLSLSYQEDLWKVLKTIKSCESEHQTEAAEKAFELWKQKWEHQFKKPYPDYFYEDIEMIEEVIEEKFGEVDLGDGLGETVADVTDEDDI